MSIRKNLLSDLSTITFIGNYVPQQCGIATFTHDLLQAITQEIPQTKCWAVAINDRSQGYAYPNQVRFEINMHRLEDYQLAAEFLNVNDVNIICMQHEFGIYGGDSGNYILTLLRNLSIPIITTLHTVLPNPSTTQRRITERIAKLSDRLVVMSQKAEILLKEIYNVPADKIAIIHHGIPDLPFVDPNFYKDKFGVEGKNVIMTFGLINPGKGIERMIEALPEIVKQYPNVVYIVLGATHPNIKKEQGEEYRYSLYRKIRALGVEKNVIFYNRFVDLKELIEFLGAADIYITPYINKDQITSGTLAYALGAGKAIISTPYLYAEEMLSDGRGIIVPFGDSKTIAAKVINLLENNVEYHAMRKQAYIFSRKMIWKEVARNYIDLFAEVIKQRLSHPKPQFRTIDIQSIQSEILQPKFDHLHRMTDDVGIFQHAYYIIPNRNEGYCTDDNSRALIAVLMAQNLSFEDDLLTNLDCRYLSFLIHAFNDKNNQFRNFMSYDRKWFEEAGSEDCHGRAIWSLGIAIGMGKMKEFADITINIFEKSVGSLLNCSSPRAWAFGLIGINAYLTRFRGDSNIKRVREELANKLFNCYCSNATDNWAWIENKVTYDNGKIPQALLISGQSLQRDDMIKAGLSCLEWLLKVETDNFGQFSPIGNNGWFLKGGEKAKFDQQPIEAQSILEACIEAFKITQDKKWIPEAKRCYEWFLGKNILNVSLYNHKTCGCSDGLMSAGINLNQGAESTLAWLLALLNICNLNIITDIYMMED
jgi:glycosyltransferase involved in cell wall biosynthesis